MGRSTPHAGWPGRVLSAILRALSWVLLPLTFLRLKAQAKRLRRESALLREELRIKDARWARVPTKYKRKRPADRPC